MASALAQEKGVQWTVDYISELWYANRLTIEDLKPSDTAYYGFEYGNKDIAHCAHVKHIFGEGRTRVPTIDPSFYEKVCKRSGDAVTKHPVLVVGNWRQGKSTLVNSLVDKEVAATGRHTRTTTRVQLHKMAATTTGDVLLADTPGLEPDTEYDIVNMYRAALEREGSSPDVLTDLIVLVIAGTPQGISSLASEKVMSWIRGTYAKARGLSCGDCTILPVITHGDQIHPEDQEADKHVVRDRLQDLERVPKGVVCAAAAPRVLEPVIVCNPDAKRGREGFGILGLKTTIVSEIQTKSCSPEFKLQWSRMLTADLQQYVHIFHEKHPHDETEVRLFHRTVEATLATYGKKSSNIETALPNASWHLLDIIERKLRNEESRRDHMVGATLRMLPCSPREVCPFFWAAGAGWAMRQAYVSRSRLAQGAIRLLSRVH